MPTPPDFVNATALDASSLNAVGLWLVKTQTLSTGQTSITVSDAFNSDYSRYLIQIEDLTRSAGGNILFQLSGITGTVYSSSGLFTTYGSGTLTGYAPAAASTVIIGYTNTGGGFIQATITNPNSASAKDMFTESSNGEIWYRFSHRIGSNTTATGFVLSVSGAGVTFGGGVVKVYGYRD